MKILKNIAVNEPWPNNPLRHQRGLILALLLFALGVRVWLLLASQHFLRSDEAVVAMMAMDILEGGPIPFFLYGQSYGGGQAVDALLAVPLFAVFGPSAYMIKVVQILFSIALLFVVYLSLYRFVGKRYALLATATLSFFSTFILFNFFYHGGMAMSFFGWLGLYFFFRGYFEDDHTMLMMALSGAAIGFSCYCFEYAYVYLAGVAAFWILKGKDVLLRQWRPIVCFVGGGLIGISPLIYYNLTHDFANLKQLLYLTSSTDSGMAGSFFNQFFSRFFNLFSHDLPSFFSLSIIDFPETIPTASYLAYSIFVVSVAYVVLRTRSGFIALARSFVTGHKAIMVQESRIIFIFLLLLIYFVMYCLSSSGGTTPRYLLAAIPMIPMFIAWTAYDFGRRYKAAAAIFLLAFLGIQMQHLIVLAKDTSVSEWRIKHHGEDIDVLAKYLLDNNLTTVLTPYEIKWRLMFASKRKIICASYIFGFDREMKYNNEVVDRVNRRGMPLAIVFDKDYRMHQIALNFNPEGAFDLEGFIRFLQDNQITYKVTPVGRDYVVYHDFSKHFPLPE
ncbi:MAG: glycosyltransferase family 39 protein [Proteobacteria bacterium]|nr:glycosyltransferase family 39 protein [Pseudomonadota bacterium]MBU1687344.1 glycosyltransferase family 39 protein [Pseudomonadota bacterium]